MKKAQTFSTDAVVAVALFIIAVITLFYLSGPAAENQQSERLQSEADKLPSLFSSEQNTSAVFVQGSEINDQRLSEAVNLSYDNLKSLLGIDSEFCIYLEDEKGNILPLEGKVGIGSHLANISGRSCNETIQ